MTVPASPPLSAGPAPSGSNALAQVSPSSSLEEGENAGSGNPPLRPGVSIKLVASRGQVPDDTDEALSPSWYTAPEDSHPNFVFHRRSGGEVLVRRLEEGYPEGGPVEVLVLGCYEPGTPWSRTWGAAEQMGLSLFLTCEGIDPESANIEMEHIHMPQDKPHRFTSEDDEGIFNVDEVASQQQAPAPAAALEVGVSNFQPGGFQEAQVQQELVIPVGAPPQPAPQPQPPPD